MNGLGEQVVERFKLSWRLQRQDFGAQAGKNKHHSFPARCGGVKKNKREEREEKKVFELMCIYPSMNVKRIKNTIHV